MNSACTDACKFALAHSSVCACTSFLCLHRCAPTLCRVYTVSRRLLAGIDATTRSRIYMFIATDSFMDASLTFYKPYSTSEELLRNGLHVSDCRVFDSIRRARLYQTCQPSFPCQLACPRVCATALMLRSATFEDVVFVHFYSYWSCPEVPGTQGSRLSALARPWALLGSAPACRRQRARAIACQYVLASSCVRAPDVVLACL